MGRMSDFVIEVGEELNEMKPNLTWDEIMRRVTGIDPDPDVEKIKMDVFDRIYNRW